MLLLLACTRGITYANAAKSSRGCSRGEINFRPGERFAAFASACLVFFSSRGQTRESPRDSLVACVSRLDSAQRSAPLNLACDELLPAARCIVVRRCCSNRCRDDVTSSSCPGGRYNFLATAIAIVRSMLIPSFQGGVLRISPSPRENTRILIIGCESY